MPAFPLSNSEANSGLRARNCLSLSSSCSRVGYLLELTTFGRWLSGHCLHLISWQSVYKDFRSSSSSCPSTGKQTFKVSSPSITLTFLNQIKLSSSTISNCVGGRSSCSFSWSAWTLVASGCCGWSSPVGSSVPLLDSVSPDSIWFTNSENWALGAYLMGDLV